MAFGSGKAIGSALIDIRPDASKFAGDLFNSVNAGLTAVEDKALGSTLGRSLTSLGVGVLVTSTETLTNNLREVVTLGADLGPVQGQLQSYTADVQALGLEYGKLSGETVPALYQALSAGVPRDNAAEFLGTAAEAATAGVASLEESVSVLAASTNTFAAQGLTATEASDLLFTAVRGGVTTFGELSASIGTVGPAAAAAGAEFGEVTAAIAALTKAGIGTDQASTQLRALFNELQTSSTAVAQQFNELSGESFREFTANGGEVIDALRLLDGAATESGLAIGDLFGSVEASTAATVLAGQGFSEYESQLAAAATSAGAATDAFDVMNDGLTADLNRIRAAGQIARQELGEAFLPVAEDLAAAAVDVLPSILELTQAFSGGLGAAIQGVAIPAIKLITPPLELLATVVSKIPEPVFAAAAAFRVFYRLTTTSLATNLAIMGLTKLSDGMLSVAASSERAGASVRAVKFAGVADRAANAASRVSGFAATLQRVGHVAPFAAAGVALFLPAILDMIRSGDLAAEQLAAFNAAIEEAGGANIASSIDNIEELAAVLAGVGDEAEDGAEAVGEVVTTAIRAAISAGLSDGLLNDAEIAAALDPLADIIEAGLPTDEISRVLVGLDNIGPSRTLSQVLEGSLGGQELSQTTVALGELANGLDLSGGQLKEFFEAVEGAAAANEGRLSTSFEEARDAINRVTPEFENVSDSMIEAAKTAATSADGNIDYAAAVQILEASLASTESGVVGYALALAGVPGPADNAAGATNGMAAAMGYVRETADEARDAIDGLNDSYRDAFDLAVDAEESQQAFIDSIEKLRDLAVDTSEIEDEAARAQAEADNLAIQNLDRRNDAGQEARETITDMANATLDDIDAMKEQEVSIERQQRYLDRRREKILDVADAAGVARDQAQEFLDVTLGFPGEVITIFGLDDQGLGEFLDRLDGLEHTQYVRIIADAQMTADYVAVTEQQGGTVGLPGAPQPTEPQGANGLLISARSGGQRILAGEAGDDEVLINPRSSINRQMYLARESGLLDNILGAVGGGGTVVNQTIKALSYDERVLAQFAREAVRDVMAEVAA